MVVEWDLMGFFYGIYPLVDVYRTLENHHFKAEKTHYVYMAIFNSKLLVYLTVICETSKFSDLSAKGYWKIQGLYLSQPNLSSATSDHASLDTSLILRR